MPGFWAIVDLVAPHPFQNHYFCLIMHTQYMSYLLLHQSKCIRSVVLYLDWLNPHHMYKITTAYLWLSIFIIGNLEPFVTQIWKIDVFWTHWKLLVSPKKKMVTSTCTRLSLENCSVIYIPRNVPNGRPFFILFL